MELVYWRLLVFVGLLVVLLGLQARWPRIDYAARGIHLPGRWLAHAALTLLNSALLKLLLPLGAVGAALWAQDHGIGLFNHSPMPAWLGGLICFLLLDLLIYWQHRLFHRVDFLWRLHKVHHSDVALDVSSALRFHSLEMLLSMLIKMLAIIALGAPPLSVLLFEIVLNAMAMFNHANWALSKTLDGHLRKWLVTPDMHRIHHSIERSEQDSNFAFNLSLWDRLFKSYCAAPKLGDTHIILGLADKQTTQAQRQSMRLSWILSLPFKKDQ